MIRQSIPAGTREYLLKKCRLIERQLFRAVFDGGDEGFFIRALAAYQNPDGGFGHGLEPDVLSPVSTGIALETALYYIDIYLRCMKRHADHAGDAIRAICDQAGKWVERSVTDGGLLPAVPDDIAAYPHQSWWLDPDETRVLAIAGFCAKLNIRIAAKTRRAIAAFADSLPVPDELTEYNYPLFVYAAHETSYAQWDSVLDRLQRKLTEHIYVDRDRYFLLTRYWYHFIDMMPDELVERQVELFYSLVEQDGGVMNPFPELSWWRPIITLDYLLILKSCNLLE